MSLGDLAIDRSIVRVRLPEHLAPWPSGKINGKVCCPNISALRSRRIKLEAGLLHFRESPCAADAAPRPALPGGVEDEREDAGVFLRLSFFVDGQDGPG